MIALLGEQWLTQLAARDLNPTAADDHLHQTERGCQQCPDHMAATEVERRIRDCNNSGKQACHTVGLVSVFVTARVAEVARPRDRRSPLAQEPLR